MRVCFFLLIFAWKGATLASSEEDLHKGDQLAQELLGKMKTQEPDSHPFYQGTPSEFEPELAHKAETIARESPAAQMVRESSTSRPQFKIDPEKDPLLQGAEEITANPLPLIGGEGTQAVSLTQTGKDEVLTCEEPGEESEETCTRTLQVRVERTKVQKEWQGWFHVGKCSNKERHGHYLPCQALGNVVRAALWGEGWGSDIQGVYKACMDELRVRAGTGWGCECSASLPELPCSQDKIKEVMFLPHPHNPGLPLMAGEHYHMYRSGRDEWWVRPVIKVIFEEDSVKVFPDEWGSTCGFLEERADQGLCSYVSKVCTQGPGTRVIDGVPITRDCWQETYTYACSYPAQNTCGPLRARGCAQIKSECKERVGSACVVYTQTYHCKGNSNTTTRITGGSTPFCLDGNCRDQSFALNEEMMSSLAQLSLLKDMQGPFDGLLFKGSDDRCSRATLSFKDCCGSGKGWGVSLGLAGCSADEKALQLKRQKGLCHFVGTYCSKREKLTNICLQKKSTYCCFGSKLLKAFHEQGRAQIGMHWGNPKEPACRGFTIEELQRIDFSKLDLREVFEDLMKHYQPQKLENVNQRIKERIETLRGLEPPKKGSTLKQREEA